MQALFLCKNKTKTIQKKKRPLVFIKLPKLSLSVLTGTDFIWKVNKPLCCVWVPKSDLWPHEQLQNIQILFYQLDTSCLTPDLHYIKPFITSVSAHRDVLSCCMIRSWGRNPFPNPDYFYFSILLSRYRKRECDLTAVIISFIYMIQNHNHVASVGFTNLYSQWHSLEKASHIVRKCVCVWRSYSSRTRVKSYIVPL